MIAQSNILCLNLKGLRQPDDFSFKMVNELKVSCLFLGLEDAAAGCDEITVKVIKNALTYIIQPLTHIINCSLITGIIPSKLKITRVMPIIKKGLKH